MLQSLRIRIDLVTVKNCDVKRLKLSNSHSGISYNTFTARFLPRLLVPPKGILNGAQSAGIFCEQEQLEYGFGELCRRAHGASSI